jgi:hypothetical protein
MRDLTVPKWVPPAAKAALSEAANTPGLTPGDRAVLERLASHPAMREVWLKKLPSEPAIGAGWVLDNALWYAMSRTFELRYSDGAKPTLGDVKRSAWHLVHEMQAMALSGIAEETWACVRGEDRALDFKTLVAAVEKLPQFLELFGQQHSNMFDTLLPTVARPRWKGSRQIFFCKGMAQSLRWLYGQPLYEVITILAQVVFDLPQALDPDTVKKRCTRR